MGKLFWKFFFGFWACLLFASVVTGGGLHLLRQSGTEGDFAEGPKARMMLEMAQVVLEAHGPEDVRKFLKKGIESEGRELPLYVVSEDGKDILGREVPQSIWRHIVEKKAPAGKQGERWATASDQSKWVLFVPKMRGPFDLRLGEGDGMAPEPPMGPPPSEFGGGGMPPPPPNHAPPPWIALPWVWLGMALFASLMFAAGLAHWFSRPLNKLKDAFREAAKGRLGLRIASSTERGEIAELMKGFDHMAGEIETKIRQQSTLLHDVSHELRSPLARLNLAVGLLRQSPTQFEKSLDRIELEAERLDALIGELLNLSRLEGQKNTSDWQQYNVVDLLSAVVDDAAFEAGQWGKQVEFDASFPAWSMRCEPEILQRAFDNIIRNAIRYTPVASAVRVRLEVFGADQLRIMVQDSGPGVSAEVLSNLFVPFFKFGAHAGHGLGLAIAKRAIERHGGSVHAENISPRGLLFCIDLTR